MENGFWEKETHGNKKSWKTFMMVHTEIMKLNLQLWMGVEIEAQVYDAL